MKKLGIAVLSLFFLIPPIPQGLGAQESPEQEALTVYPQKIRQAIAEVCMQPTALKAVMEIQRQAAAELKKLLAPYPRSFQHEVYQLLRFPKLLNELTAGGAKTTKEIKTLVRPYPKEIHKIAQNLAMKDFPLLQNIQAINVKSDRQFEEALPKKSPETRAAFLILLQHPEILLILEKDPSLAGSVAKAQSKDPEAGQQKAGEVLVRAQGGNAKSLKNQPERTPQQEQALASLEKSEKAFSAESEKEFQEVLDPRKAVQMNANFNPWFYPYLGAYGVGLYNYPYWFGFPGWGFDGWD